MLWCCSAEHFLWVPRHAYMMDRYTRDNAITSAIHVKVCGALELHAQVLLIINLSLSAALRLWTAPLLIVVLFG
jgi:hypothetical protein